MLKTLVVLSLFFMSCVCVQAQSDNYIDNPNSKDTLCIYELKLAKIDFSEGKLKLCVNAKWNVPYSRMYPELDSICKYYGLIFNPDTGVEQDVQFVDFTYDCYEAFMNREILKKFGDGFREHLLDLADSVFIAKSIHDTVSNYLCDKGPKACSKDFERDFFSLFRYPKTCKFDSLCRGCECSECDFRVLFVIDTLGHATNYKFYGSHSPINNICVNEIKNNIIAALEKLNCWNSGVLGNHKVLSYGDLLIDFSRKDIR